MAREKKREGKEGKMWVCYKEVIAILDKASTGQISEYVGTNIIKGSNKL